MCDYSLMCVPHRLVVEGEQLVVHRFRTGSMGLASPLDLQPVILARDQRKGFWARLSLLLDPSEPPPVQAVCIPPGARLVLEDIPEFLQAALEVEPVELVTLTEITLASSSPRPFGTVGSHRDAVRFKNDSEVLLQDLCEGQLVWVRDLGGAEASEPVREDTISRKLSVRT
jgi:hypothetical protein